MDNLSFRLMEKHEFDKYIISFLEDYIKDISQYEEEFINQMGKHPREFAEQQFKDTLPDGMNTLNNFFWIAVERKNGKNIGFFWFSIIPEKALSLLSQIRVFEEYRGLGYGTQILCFWENYIVNTHPEIDRLYLHVFKHNVFGKDLFEKSGFTLFYESFEGDNLLKMLDKKLE